VETIAQLVILQRAQKVALYAILDTTQPELLQRAQLALVTVQYAAADLAVLLVKLVTITLALPVFLFRQTVPGIQLIIL
jgi:hypothetical protein